MDNLSGLDSFLEDFSRINKKKVLVHGGGNQVTSLAGKLGLLTELVDGRRITNPENLEVAVMVYAGWLNTSVVSKLNVCKTRALGLSGADLNMIQAQKRRHPTIDYGEVGDISPESINTDMLQKLLDSGITPVFCSITHSDQGDLLNTNADTIAACLAVGLSPLYDVHLTYCLEYNGVLADGRDPKSWMKKLIFSEYRSMVHSGEISKGMLPKLDNAFNALQKKVKSVRIKNAMNINGSKGTLLQLD